MHLQALIPHSNHILTLLALTAASLPCAGEPLDASTSILLVYFEALPTAAGADAAAAAEEPGMLATYELFLEQRGEGAYKVGAGCLLL